MKWQDVKGKTFFSNDVILSLTGYMGIDYNDVIITK